MDFCLGCHSLTSATLQTIVEHCTSYDKDHWTGTIGRDRRPTRSPLANSASPNPSNIPAAYEAMEQVSFNYHLSGWRSNFSDTAEKCMICQNLAREKKHSTAKCPILKKLGFKIKKRSAADNSNKPLHVLPLRVLPLPHLLPPPPLPQPPTLGGVQSTSWELARLVLRLKPTTQEMNSTMRGNMRVLSMRVALNLANPIPITLLIHIHAPTLLPRPSATPHTICANSTRTAVNPKGVITICLPKHIMAPLNNPPAHSIRTFSDAHRPRTSLLVADTGATNHMIPDKSAFISYPPCLGWQVCMGNNLFAPILGSGTAIISLNGKRIFIRDCLHVPLLQNPLYSLRAHQQQGLWHHGNVWNWHVCFLSLIYSWGWHCSWLPPFLWTTGLLGFSIIARLGPTNLYHISFYNHGAAIGPSLNWTRWWRVDCAYICKPLA